MATNSLYPSFVQIHYRSAYGKHVQTIQTRQWSAGVGSHGFGGYTTWGGSSMDADSMVNGFINAIVPFASDAISWDECIVYNYPAPLPALPNPVAVFPLTQVGVLTDVPAAEALQMTLNFFDASFNQCKIVLLDLDVTGSFKPEAYAGLTTLKKNFVDYYLSDVHAFASRADVRPTVFRQCVWKYNDKLRKEYHLT